MVRYPPECGGEEEEVGWIGNSDCGCNISLISIKRGLCVISAGMWSCIVSFSQHRPSVCRHGAIKCYFVHWLNLFIISKRHAEETCPGYWFLRIFLWTFGRNDWLGCKNWQEPLCMPFFFCNRECMTRCSQELYKDPLTKLKPSKAFAFCCLFDYEKQKLFMKIRQPSSNTAVSWSWL